MFFDLRHVYAKSLSCIIAKHVRGSLSGRSYEQFDGVIYLTYLNHFKAI